MRQGALAFALSLGLAFGPGGTARADHDPAYPVASFTDWTGNPRRDAQDQETGAYNFEEGFLGAARRAVRRAPAPGDLGSDDAQEAVDSAGHNRPDFPNSHWGDVGHPMFTPDWDHDGVFGDSGGTDLDGTGDFDADTDHLLDTAYFRFPCYDADWGIHHRLGNGSCEHEIQTLVPPVEADYAHGLATEAKVVNTRGLVLDVTLWLPMSAVNAAGCPAFGSPAYGDREAWAACLAPSNLADVDLPAVIFSNGFSSRQEHYSWFAMRMVEEGYVVIIYDPAGQGESEGTGFDLFGATDAERLDCQFAGACRDLQDVARWFAGQDVIRVEDFGPRATPRLESSGQPPNPVVAVVDLSRLALAGNSMGAIGTLDYVNRLAAGAQLPAVRAAISMSGATQTRAIVPIQFQTSDYDGSPTLLGPSVFGANLGAGGDGIGYQLVKTRYDGLRATNDPGALELVVLEGGVHTDHVDAPFITRTLWANAVAADYAAAWLDCHVLGDQAACAAAVAPHAKLSKGFASEQDADGPAGPGPSRCIVVPTEPMLNQRPQDFAAAAQGAPVYDCAP